MTAAGDREARVLVLAPAWRQLAMLAAAARRDWAWEDIRTALLAAETAGWDFEKALREVFRLILDTRGDPADLRNAVRAERRQPVYGPEVNARGRELARVLYENRPTRPEAGVTDDQEGHE